MSKKATEFSDFLKSVRVDFINKKKILMRCQKCGAEWDPDHKRERFFICPNRCNIKYKNN